MSEFSWIKSARSKIGVREIKGPKHNPIILNMWKLIKRAGIKTDEDPWCAAFVGASLEEGGLISTRYESAKSYLDWGVPTKICYGCVALITRIGGSGYHVGFVIGVNHAGLILVLGGNQNNEVNISAFNPERIKACRWPSPVYNPKLPLPVLSIAEASSSEA